jgi:hypothetical protein
MLNPRRVEDAFRRPLWYRTMGSRFSAYRLVPQQLKPSFLAIGECTAESLP